MKYALILPLVALSACQSTPIYRDRVQTVNVPVSVPCATTRPAPVTPLADRYTDEQWQSLDVRQKAAAVGRQSLDRMTYGEQLHAATGACPEIDGGAE